MKKKLRITFLNPPFLKKFSRPQRSPAVTKSGTLYYPMWLSYAAALAEKQGHEIDVIDAPADGYDEDTVLKKLREFSPDLIVSDTSTPSIYNDIQVCEKIREIMPQVFILLVGTHISALPEESLALSKSVDAVAFGEYDQTVVEVAEAVSQQRDMQSVKGIYYWDSGTAVRNQQRPLLEDLDQIPFVSTVYKRFLRMENYFNPNALYPMVTIVSSRGCPFRCIFCVYPQTMMGHKMRLRSVKAVVDEIEFIAGAFRGVKAVFFEDDTFTANKQRCIEISSEIVRRGIDISWTANARATLDYETMSAMKKAGCRCLCVGFESGNQGILDIMKKKITIEGMENFMQDARKAGILVHGCFMVGLPGETRDTMMQTLDLAKRLCPDTVQFYPVMIYPGTEAYNWYQERGLIATRDFSQWITPGGLHNTVIRTDELSSEELVRFCDFARRKFYLRPRYFFYKIRQMVTHPEEVRRNLKAARTFVRYLLKGSDIAHTSL